MDLTSFPIATYKTIHRYVFACNNNNIIVTCSLYYIIKIIVIITIFYSVYIFFSSHACKLFIFAERTRDDRRKINKKKKKTERIWSKRPPIVRGTNDTLKSILSHCCSDTDSRAEQCVRKRGRRRYRREKIVINYIDDMIYYHLYSRHIRPHTVAFGLACGETRKQNEQKKKNRLFKSSEDRIFSDVPVCRDLRRSTRRRIRIAFGDSSGSRRGTPTSAVTNSGKY